MKQSKTKGGSKSSAMPK
jgi:serine/threonine-protein phosphatase 2A regulatory subunit B'